MVMKMKSEKIRLVKLQKMLLRTAPIAALLLLGACVGTEQDLRYLNDQIVSLNSRVSGIEDTVGERLEGTLDDRIQAVKEEQVETGQDLDELKREVQNLSNRVDEHRALVRKVVEKDTTEQGAGMDRLSDLDARTTRLEASVARIMKKLEMEGAPVISAPSVADLPAPAPGAEPDRPDAEQDAEQAKPSQPDEDLYKKTLSIYKEGKFEEALDGFEGFLEEYPESGYAENAQFWIGECHMSMKRYEQAILAFQKVITDYPKGNKVPGATYRQAVAFYEINDKISARLLLNRVIRSYPDSEEADLAKKKLDAIK
jgi:tol-pal system protein YbgF